MAINKLSACLLKAFPELYTTGKLEIVDIVYCDYAALDTFMSKIWTNKDNESLFLLKKIFNFLLYLLDNKELYEENIENLIDVSIYEGIITYENAYSIAEAHMPARLYEHFNTLYPKEENENIFVDAKNYYSKEYLISFYREMGLSEWENRLKSNESPDCS